MCIRHNLKCSGFQADDIACGSALAVFTHGDINIAAQPGQDPHESLYGYVAKLALEETRHVWLA